VRLGDRIRSAVESALPWFDRKAADRNHRTTQIVLDQAEAVLGRRESMRSSYQRAGTRLSGR